jgi:hypothetical protein
MKGIAEHFKDPLNLILSLLVALSLLGAWMYAKEAAGIDYYVAWVTADAVKNDPSLDIYDPSSKYKLAVKYRNKADELKDAPRQKINAGHHRKLNITATPFLYWVTGLLATGDYEKDLMVWHTLSILMLTISVLLMCRLLGYSTSTSLAILLPVMVWFAPLQSDLRVANVNSLQLGFIGLVLWLQSRAPKPRILFITGLTIGLLVSFKPNLAPIALLIAGGWLVRRQTMKLGISVAGMASGSALAILVSSWWMGSLTVWIDWLTVIRRAVEKPLGNQAGNYTVVSQGSGGLSATNQLGLAIALCLLCLVLFWWGRRNTATTNADNSVEYRESLENTALLAMGCIVAMLASALVWLHYYLLIIPMLIFVFRPWREPGAMRLIPLLLQRMLPALVLLLLMDSPLSRLPGVDSSTYWVMVTKASTVTLFVIGLWQFAYGLRDQPDQKPAGVPASH